MAAYLLHLSRMAAQQKGARGVRGARGLERFSVWIPAAHLQWEEADINPEIFIPSESQIYRKTGMTHDKSPASASRILQMLLFFAFEQVKPDKVPFF